MRKLLVILILSMCLQVQAFVNPLDEYPEERNKQIYIYKGKSELKLKKKDQQELTSLYDDYIAGAQAEITDFVGQAFLNNFSMGNGRVDVTYQVKRGAELALKEIFAGYPEYQRRQVTEEILNANYKSHKITDKFLLNVTEPKIFKPSILRTIDKLNHSLQFYKLHQLFKAIAYSLLALITVLIIMRRMTSNGDWDYAISAPLFNAGFSFLMIMFSGSILNIIIKLANALNNTLLQFLDTASLEHFIIAINWQKLIAQTGYLPGLILSCVDILAQFFLYFFIAGLILSVVIGKILSPLWALAFVSDSLKSNAINSFIAWVKLILTIVFIPLAYMIIKYMIYEFDYMELYFLEVSLSIAGFIYLPTLSSVILSNGHGVFEPAFGGYRNIIDSINNSYESIRAAIELNSSDQLIANQLNNHEDLLYQRIHDANINR